jgi:hypothetical protein
MEQILLSGLEESSRRVGFQADLLYYQSPDNNSFIYLNLLLDSN